jgi:hypothetical protein
MRRRPRFLSPSNVFIALYSRERSTSHGLNFSFTSIAGQLARDHRLAGGICEIIPGLIE